MIRMIILFSLNVCSIYKGDRYASMIKLKQCIRLSDWFLFQSMMKFEKCIQSFVFERIIFLDIFLSDF